MLFKFKSIKLWVWIIGTTLVCVFNPNRLADWLIFSTPFYMAANVASKRFENGKGRVGK